MNSRRTALVVMAAMLGSAALADWARPTIKVSDSFKNFKLDAVFPKSFGDWRVDENLPVIVPPPDQQAQLDKIYNQTLARTYVNREGARVMLSVAYGGDQSDGLTVHVPDVCYVSQGFRMGETRDATLQVSGDIVIPVRHLMMTMGPRLEVVTYWVLMGDEATTSNTQRKWVSIRYGLKRQIPEGMLIRVSSINPEMDKAIPLHKDFINQLMLAMPENQRDRVIGRVSVKKDDSRS
ncbi:exosortase-associated protein EpsI, B-type [Roseateles oligotrophus]|uniref:EpsI family protein n=1 Tax=Roseateles oligotrophus TaxID=1769250 RepID=A0ABT2YJE0_9BURK|nr:exosortase-associated protein EpsI, B-type [Roseateles oligotrophus]MCV2370148.1 EpsI family protein [Roseateles oligotrophus]